MIVAGGFPRNTEAAAEALLPRQPSPVRNFPDGADNCLTAVRTLVSRRLGRCLTIWVDGWTYRLDIWQSGKANCVVHVQLNQKRKAPPRTDKTWIGGAAPIHAWLKYNTAVADPAVILFAVSGTKKQGASRQ